MKFEAYLSTVRLDIEAVSQADAIVKLAEFIRNNNLRSSFFDVEEKFNVGKEEGQELRIAAALAAARDWHVHATSDPDTEIGARDAIDDVAERLADIYATANPNFDRARFLAACRGDAP